MIETRVRYFVDGSVEVDLFTAAGEKIASFHVCSVDPVLGRSADGSLGSVYHVVAETRDARRETHGLGTYLRGATLVAYVPVPPGPPKPSS